MQAKNWMQRIWRFSNKISWISCQLAAYSSLPAVLCLLLEAAFLAPLVNICLAIFFSCALSSLRFAVESMICFDQGWCCPQSDANFLELKRGWKRFHLSFLRLDLFQFPNRCFPVIQVLIAAIQREAETILSSSLPGNPGLDGKCDTFSMSCFWTSSSIYLKNQAGETSRRNLDWQTNRKLTLFVPQPTNLLE